MDLHQDNTIVRCSLGTLWPNFFATLFTPLPHGFLAS